MTKEQDYEEFNRLSWYDKEILTILYRISLTLEQMKKQEHDYWETWKKNKEISDNPN